ELDEQLQPSLISLYRLQVEMRRDDGKMRKCPFASFDIMLFRNREFEQVTHGRRQHVAVAFVVIVLLLETAERLGDVAGDGRFLGDDQRFSHGSDRLDLPVARNCAQYFFFKRSETWPKNLSKSKP